MAVSTKILKAELNLFKPFVDGCGIDTIRMGQDALGKLIASASGKYKVAYEPCEYEGQRGVWIRPKTRLKDGVIMYLHGGGYVAGDIEYVKGYGTALCAENNADVFGLVYRLAPEYKFPVPVEDAVKAYNYLLGLGYTPDRIVISGESAGGGLCFALCLKLRELGIPLPAGILAISPWTNLKCNGASYDYNEDKDPSMTKERLLYYASLYTDKLDDPMVSPAFADLRGMPPTLLFAGGDEILLDDTELIYSEMIACGCRVERYINPGMWHAYVLYGIKEAAKDRKRITSFISELLPSKEQK